MVRWRCLFDAEAAADVEDGPAGDAVELAEAVDRGVVGLGDFVEGVAAADGVELSLFGISGGAGS